MHNARFSRGVIVTLVALIAACGSSDTGGDESSGSADAGGDAVEERDTPSEDTSEADTAVEEDAGGEDDVTVEQGCGDLTYQGECAGNTVRWCDDETNTVAEIDCAERFGDLATGTCEYFDEEFGHWCAVQVGDPCLFALGGEPQAEFCVPGDGTACLIGSEASECVTGVGSCEDEVDDGTCQGDIYIFVCSITQIAGVDCAASGGTCDADLDACVDLEAGAACGDLGVDGAEPFTCAEGLVCDEGGRSAALNFG